MSEPTKLLKWARASAARIRQRQPDSTNRENVILELDDEIARLMATIRAAQQQADIHAQQLAHRVMDVFENADEDALAEDIQADIYAAIGLQQAFAGDRKEQS